MTIDNKENLINSLEELNSMAEAEKKNLYANVKVRYEKTERQYLKLDHITSSEFMAVEYENPATQNKGTYEFRSLDLVDLIAILRIIPAETLETAEELEYTIQDLKQWLEFVKLCNYKKEHKGASL